MPTPERRRIGLKLALEALGVGLAPNSFEDRLRLQKGAYLAQEMGVPLGYRFNWYLKGPYSPELAADYFQELGRPGLAEGYRLSPQLHANLQALREATDPVPVPLPRARWMELLASIHYLRTSLNKSVAESHAVIQAVKPQLAPYIPAAEQTLADLGLIA